jgi:acetylornithine deacetylase
LIHWVRDYLAGFGVDSELVFDATGRKANLFATIGAADRPGVILSGHTDVVPVDGQEWDTDPFKLVEKDGKLFGRGTCDMKSFSAVALALMPQWAKRGNGPPIHLALSYDEEVGCIGVRGLIDRLVERSLRPIACVVGEPTRMQVVRAHKGKVSFRCRVRGFECHSSLAPRGVNAVEVAAEIVMHVTGMGRRFAKDGPFDHDFDIPWTTCHTGVISGGTALNIVPKDCWFDFEFRHLPEQDPRQLFEEVRRAAGSIEVRMQAVAKDTGIAFEELSQIPGLSGREDTPAIELAKAASGRNATTKVAFGTEAGLFERAGIPTVVCGPGDIDQAHKPNEFVTLDQVAECEAFLTRLVDRLSASR